MSLAYIAIAVAVVSTALGGGYLLYRRLLKNEIQQNRTAHAPTLQEIARIAALEEEMANREEQFIKQGQIILTQMQEYDQAYKRWEHAKEY